MKHYDALTCRGSRDTLDLILAVSSLLPITGVLDENESVTLYFDQGNLNDEVRHQLRQWLPENAELDMRLERVEEQNWNAEFERSLEPITVGDDLIITQSWHPIEQEPHGPMVIMIDPKMSFGTGHHESTRLIARLMLDIDFRGKRVLDIGTGTGVLAIIASKRHAARVLAFDNNEWAVANAYENAILNEVDDLDIRHCELEAIAESGFDIILANLHRNIIIDLLPQIVEKFSDSEPMLFTSGVLIQDYESLLDEAARYGLSPVAEERENEWVATRFAQTK